MDIQTEHFDWERLASHSACLDLLLNVLRNNENARALRLSCFIQVIDQAELASAMSRHFADEARHTMLLTELLRQRGARVEPPPADLDYVALLESGGVGVPFESLTRKALLGSAEQQCFLVSDEILEKRGVQTMSRVLQHVSDPQVSGILGAILEDEIQHVRLLRDSLDKVDFPATDTRQTLSATMASREQAVTRRYRVSLNRHMARLAAGGSN